MSNISIGVTATELFAYNPFRILGTAVNTPHDKITETYNRLMQMAESGEIDGYTTPYDFDSLPPFTRTSQSLKTAYAKLASNGYRCFAYADSEFSVSLNIDDIALNLRDITCYDCFLRCYMWLITNDRDMYEHDLWIQLARYIDKIIASSPDEWSKYFEDRFPADMVDGGGQVYKSFHSTFCQIILLPLKEMVRGSMKCSTAIEILQCAKIDVDEEFEFIEIPQANVPEKGEPEPKLKIALKDGEEYFDITTGKMVSYSTDTQSAESNSFDNTSSAPLAAEVLIDDEPEVAEVSDEPEIADEPAADTITEEEPVPQQTVAPEPEIIPERVSEPEPVRTPEPPVQSVAPTPEPAVQDTQEPVRRPHRERHARSAQPQTQTQTQPQATAAPTPKAETAQPVQPIQSQPAQTAAQPEKKPAAPRRSFRNNMAERRTDTAPAATETQPEQTVDFNSGNPFFNMNSKKDDTPSPNRQRRSTQGFTKVVEEAEKKEEAAHEAADYNDEDGEENLYTTALIEMLRSSSSRETMKSADTRHALESGAKELTAAAPTTASMDSINMSKYDDKLLASPFDKAPKKLTREERYRNVKIDDMLSTGGVGKNFEDSAIEQYKKKKAAAKQNFKSILTLTGVLALCLIIFAVMWLNGII